MSFTLRDTYATLPKTTRGVPLVINGDPKGKNFLYCNGKNVIIRDIENPNIVDIYAQHSTSPIVAKYSPSGFYIASGDQSGKVRIWDTTQKEHILKNEFQPLGGAIKDINWSDDSQRIAVAGEGKEKFAHVFMADTGTSVGEIMGHSKSINSIDFKPNRPYRIATAGEDHLVCFFQGPPFKFSTNCPDHTRFVNCVRYAPNGEVFISGGADGNAFVFNGKDGSKIGQLGDPAHKGGIYGMSFSPNSKEILTVSADKTCKVWDVESKQCLQEFVMGTTIDDMQVGCLWQNNHLLSVSLSGNINYLDRENPSTPLRVIKAKVHARIRGSWYNYSKSDGNYRHVWLRNMTNDDGNFRHGHNKPITALAISDDKKTAYTGASDSAIRRWNLTTGECEDFKGKGHSNQIMDIAVIDNTIISIGMDDMAMFTPEQSDTMGNQIKMPSQPRNLTGGPGSLVVVACAEEVVVMRRGQIVSSLKVSYEPYVVALHPGQTELAVGSKNGNVIFIYTVNNDTLQESKQFRNEFGTITDMQYSPDGAYLATCDTNKTAKVRLLPDYKEHMSDKFAFHVARVNSVSWTPDSSHIGTGSLDGNVIRFGMNGSRNIVKGAFPLSHPNKVRWVDDHTMLAVGQCSNLKFWTFQDK